MLADLADQGAAIALRHRIVGLDLLLGIDARLEGGEECWILGRVGFGADETLAVHPVSSIPDDAAA